MNALTEGLRALGAARLIAMGVVAAGLLAVLFLLVTRGGSERFALLYSELDAREAGQIVELLDRQKIAYQLGAGGTQVMVPADQVARARVMLARDGLPSGGSIGYEIFDRGDGVTASQFQQKISETRALEGELSRSIRTLNGVRAARVHLVMPRREPFSREKPDAQASVMLTTVGAGRLDREAIQAVVNLVAAAVPGLRPRNVSVVDSRGNLLARAGEPVGAVATALGAEEVRRATELRLARAVEEMLERSLGPGRVRAEAAVDMDFERVQETQEKFDPDGQVVRSSQTVTDNTRSTEANPTVSVQNNLPNADAGTQSAGSQEQRLEETTNFEIGKTVRTIVREQPQIRRLSVAVLVDGVEARGADGKPGWQPRPAEELERIARLVKTAVGFDEKRGDQVEVVTLRFAIDTDPTAAEARGFLGLGFESSDLSRLAQTAVVGIIAVLALLLVFRPMVLRVTSMPRAVAGSLPGPGTAATAGQSSLASADLALAAGGRPMIEGPPGSVMPGAAARIGGDGSGGTSMLEDDSMVSLTNIEGQIRASSIRRMTELVDKHPEESLSIVRAWMQEGDT